MEYTNILNKVHQLLEVHFWKKISFFEEETFDFENSICYTQVHQHLENRSSRLTELDVVRATCSTTGQNNEVFLSLPSQLVLSTDYPQSVFQLEEFQSQGDIDFQIESDSIADRITCCESNLISEDLDLKFLDSLTAASESSKKDWQDISIDMESNEESLNLSQLIDLNCDFSSEIPLQEQSFNLNSISPFTSEGFWSVPENDQEFLQTLTSSSVQDYFDDGSSSNKETESLNKLENIAVEAEKTSITDTFYDSESETSIHLAGKKYIEMRRKNNIASQRSRKIRKQKNSDMAQTLKKLEKENNDLLLLAQKLEKERDILKNQLMTIIAKK